MTSNIETEQALVDYCSNRSSSHHEDKWVHCSFERNSHTLLKVSDNSHVATFIYSQDDNEWLIFSKNENGGLSRFTTSEAARSIQAALEIVDSDGCFYQ